MENQKKRRFIIVTVEPIMGNRTKGAKGLLAGFHAEENGETMFISLFKENNYYSLSTRAYIITEVHYCINGYEAIVFYNHGINMEESKKNMKKSLAHATAVFKKFVAAAGVDLNRKGVLRRSGAHEGYPQLKDVMRRVADTPGDSSTEKDKKGTPDHPLVVQEASKEKEKTATSSEPAQDWKKPLWISRRSNQHTVKTVAEVKNELINRIAEQAAKAAAGVREEEVGKGGSDEGYMHRAGTGRTIPSGSLCISCGAKWECTRPIEYHQCGLFREERRMSLYPDGML